MTLAVVAKSDLNNYDGEANGILNGGERTAIFEGGHVVLCPMTVSEIPVSQCPSCKHFHSIGNVHVSGNEPETTKRFRVACQYPRRRVLSRSTFPLKKSYRRDLLAGISAREEATQKDHAAERKIFVDESFAVNCPLARAKTGEWRVERPPCPLCEHYKGLDSSAGKPIVLCDHPRSISFRRPVDGSFLV